MNCWLDKPGTCTAAIMLTIIINLIWHLVSFKEKTNLKRWIVCLHKHVIRSCTTKTNDYIFKLELCYINRNGITWKTWDMDLKFANQYINTHTHMNFIPAKQVLNNWFIFMNIFHWIVQQRYSKWHLQQCSGQTAPLKS